MEAENGVGAVQGVGEIQGIPAEPVEMVLHGGGVSPRDGGLTPSRWFRMNLILKWEWE